MEIFIETEASDQAIQAEKDSSFCRSFSGGKNKYQVEEKDFCITVGARVAALQSNFVD